MCEDFKLFLKESWPKINNEIRKKLCKSLIIFKHFQLLTEKYFVYIVLKFRDSKLKIKVFMK